MIVAVVLKELRLLWRDRGAIASLFILPLAFTLFLGFVFQGHDPAASRVVVVAAPERDRALAEGVTEALREAGAFRVELSGLEQAHAQVEAGQADAALIVNAQLSPETPAVLVVDAASPAALRAPLEAILTAVVVRMAAGDVGLRDPPIRRVEARRSGALPAAKEAFQVSVPGNVVLFAFFVAVTLAISLIEERRAGTWLRLLAAPVAPAAHLATKALAYLFVGLAQSGFLLMVGAVFLGLSVEGDVSALAAVIVATHLSAAGLGLLLATLGGSEKSIGALASVVLLVMGMLGGAMIPRELMPGPMRALGLLTPQGWSLDAIQMLVVVPDSGFSDVAPALGVLLAFALAVGTLGWLRFPLRN